MAAWGVTFTVVCDDCGAEARQDVGQKLRDGRLHWDSEFHCPACGASACLGFGVDETPDWVRDRLIARHGTARLRLADPAAGRVAVLKTVRGAWDVTLSRACVLAGQLAGEGLAGTLPEVTWLRERLAAGGVQADVVAGVQADVVAEVPAEACAAVSPWDRPIGGGRG
ncbi:hypothetical protein [Kitasatospora sp. CB01950]|uniref:hypothetical protein n=1 Tax=Kitasatospora sp. CB01950 TaxID=1703930 RepID=UPI000AAFC75B|nr:hypothetical protein [Kitasatospora sp. CB01950]